MFFKKIMFLYSVLFCCGVQHASQSSLMKVNQPFSSSGSSSVMSPYEVGSPKNFSEEISESLENERLKEEVLRLNVSLRKSQQEAFKLSSYLRKAETRHLILKAKLSDAETCNTSVLIGATSFVCSFFCILFCLSPSCDNKTIKVSDEIK